MSGLLNRGTFAKDPTADALQAGADKINANLLVQKTHGDTVNAGYFSVNSQTGATLSRTAVQIIQAAITYAAANGYSAVWIPKKAFDGTVLLPYDASQVTFNNGVHMLREGGNQSLDEFDVRAYGAAGNNGTDDWAAFQGLMNTISGQSTISGAFTVRIPPGLYLCSKPVWVKNAIRLVGTRVGFNNTDPAPSQIKASFMGGPVIAIQGSGTTVIGLTTALVGSGNAWSVGTNTRWISLRNYTRKLELNGLAQFCVELFYKGTGHGIFIRSQGYYLNNEGVPMGFNLWNNLNLQGSLNLSGGNKTVTGSDNVADGVLHEIVLDYDGSTLRLFRDGNIEASTAASGTVVQAFSEDITIGVSVGRAPEGSISDNGASPGTIDSVRISNASRHTANYSPSFTKKSQDGSTLALLNFDQQIGAYTRMQTNEGDAWAWEHDASGSTVGLPGFELDGVGIDGNSRCVALHFPANAQFEWSVDHFWASNVRCGIIAFDGYDHYIRRAFFKGGGGGSQFGRYGLVLGVGAGIGTLTDIWSQSFQLHASLKNGNCSVRRWFFQLDSVAYAGLLISGETLSATPHSLEQVAFNCEPGTDASRFRAPLLVANNIFKNAGIALRDSMLESGAGGTAWMVINNAGGAIGTYTFDNVQFVTLGGTPTSVFQATGTFVRPVTIGARCVQSGSWLPWSDTPGTAFVEPLGKAPAISYAATLNLDCAKQDEFEITALTGALTLNLINATPGQTIGISAPSGAGAGAITFGTINTTGAFKGASANDTTNGHYNEYTFRIGNNLNATQQGFSSGA